MIMTKNEIKMIQIEERESKQTTERIRKRKDVFWSSLTNVIAPKEIIFFYQSQARDENFKRATKTSLKGDEEKSKETLVVSCLS